MLLRLHYNIKNIRKGAVFILKYIFYDCVTYTSFYTTQSINQEDPELPYPKWIIPSDYTVWYRRKQELSVGTQTSEDWNLNSL